MLLAKPLEGLGVTHHHILRDLANRTRLETVLTPTRSVHGAETRRTTLLTTRSVIRTI